MAVEVFVKQGDIIIDKWANIYIVLKKDIDMYVGETKTIPIHYADLKRLRKSPTHPQNHVKRLIGRTDCLTSNGFRYKTTWKEALRSWNTVKVLYGY